MFRTMSVGLFAGSAAMAGLVWAGRSLVTRLTQRGRSAVEPPAGTQAAEAGWEGEALDDIAQRDSLHDMRDGQAVDLDGGARLDAIAREDALHDMGEDDSDDFDLDTRAEPEDIDVRDFEAAETVGPLELPTAMDEPYDAVDAEDVGTAWLLRATQATPPVGWNAHEVLEGGGHVIEAPTDGAGRSEDAFGADQEGAQLSDHAGTHEDDLAAELPVGTFDAAGNAELRDAVNPPDALGAPPTGQLSPTAEELARRAKG